MQRPPFSALASVYDAIMADIGYSDWAEFILTFIRSRAEPGGDGRPPQTALDLACGTGAMTRELARRGVKVTGLDGSAEMLAVARARLPEPGWPELTWLQGDLRDFALGQTFDLITCVFDSLNNLTDPADLGRALARCRAHLSAGGLLAFDVNTRAGVRDLWEGEVLEGLAPMEGGAEVHYHWSHHYDAASELGTVQAFCRVVQDNGEGEEFVELHTERGYDPPELEALLRAAGFAGWDICEYPDYAEPWPETPRVWVFAW